MDENTLNDLLECSVCLERLDTSSKVLPCQHTFCRKCLEVIVSSRQELRCPECRVLVEVKIDDLPPNVLLMRILEGMKNAASDAKSQQQQPTKPKQDVRQAGDIQQQQYMLNQLQKLSHNQHRTQQYQPNASLQQQLHLQLNSVNSLKIGPSHFIQQQSVQLLPHAYALYDFKSSESTDLQFKKGDLVFLKRRVDSNWYVGQLNNGNGVVSEGTFPINHVQVIVPLPTPQCIALYDFKMSPNEEQGCLTFKKGTIIHVLRRVDNNWAEGCIGTTIGIFPIAFVELNALAKQVLDKLYVIANNTLTSTIDTMTVTNTTSISPTTSIQQILLNQVQNPPPMPINETINSDFTTSPTSSSNSSSNSASSQSASSRTPKEAATSSTINNTCNLSGFSSVSMPNSPHQLLATSPQHEVTKFTIGSGSSSVRFRDKREKRHSLNALLPAGTMHTGLGTSTTFSILHSNRHSAEILSIPNDSPSSSDIVNKVSQNSVNVLSAAVPQSMVAREQQQQQQLNQKQIQKKQQQQQTQQSQQRINVLKTSVTQQHLPPTLPWGYLALYPYKPRKGDELELKKGCVYIVTERCLDGWFKGKNWQDITGVFPGNYVTPLRSRDQQQLMHQWKYVPLQATPIFNQANTMSVPNSGLGIQPSLTSSSPRIQSLHQPPDLPPRQVSSTVPISSVWTKPLGQTVEAFFNRCSKANDTPKDSSVKEKDCTKQKENTPSVSPNTTLAPIPPTSLTTSSAVQLMKRLAHIKSRPKSPNNAMPHQQQKNLLTQLSQEDVAYNRDKTSGGHSIQKKDSPFNSASTHGQLHPVHVRSGSCPSQLLQSLPQDQPMTNSASAGSSTMCQIQENAHKIPQLKHQQQNILQITPLAVGYGSQQLRGPKERPQLQKQSLDAATLRGVYNSSVGQHHQQQQQQNSVNTSNSSGEQQKELISSNAIISNHRKSLSLDTGAILPNPDYSNVSSSKGDVTTFISPCNITAAVAASATTKSTQSSRESRFRCVVPYPPNSDIELELQVGDIIYVQRQQKNGWYKGTQARTNKTGLFPASFVVPDI